MLLGGRPVDVERGLVPESTIRRLPVYLRCLLASKAENASVVSSLRLAEMAATNAAQVRKDLSYLGELGTRGIGYDVDSLIAHISGWLGVSQMRRVAVVGVGRLGSALLDYKGFSERGMEVVAAFDADPEKVGRVCRPSLEISPLSDLERLLDQRDVEICVIATPASVAQEIAERCVSAGVRGVLNFAPLSLDLPEQVAVRNVDLSVELQVLSFHLEKASY